MSGICIPGVEMPTTCCGCPCSYDDQCAVTRKYPSFEEWYESKPKWCPLIPVPEHGRLIDADAAKVSIVYAEKTGDWSVSKIRTALEIIDAAPTIIPADKEGEP